MRFLINLLSTTNASGRHVMTGHLSRLVAETPGRHEFVALCNSTSRDACSGLEDRIKIVACPDVTIGWVGRAWWETRNLAGVLRRERCSALFSSSGMISPGLGVPQASIAMNPWSLVRDIERSPVSHFKAILQRRQYRRTMEEARGMAFLSGYMHDAYRENANVDVPVARVTYCGIDEETFLAADGIAQDALRNLMQILCVSVMARHKGVETLVDAVALLRKDRSVPATLRLVGGWPDKKYRAEIVARVRRLGLEGAVTFTGHVSREELHHAYATAKVYSLMSRCESFGIPAVEAQAFGTPVVSSNRCAIPEVCGEGGIFPDPDRVDDVAEALARMLCEEGTWAQYSAAARANAERFRWDACAKPFVELFDEMAKG